jgi:TRAP-type C4-dicarboxylate transport system permease small subunit
MAEEIGPGESENRSKLVAGLEDTLGVAAAVVLFAMMTVTVIDVVGRYAFNAPLPSGYELIQIGMAILVFLTLPILTARDEQVRIDIFQHLFPPRMRPVLRLVNLAICLIVILGFAWFLWQRGASFTASRETTSNLRVPLAPLAFFVAAAWIAAAIMVAAQLACWRRGRDDGAPDGAAS